MRSIRQERGVKAILSVHSIDGWEAESKEKWKKHQIRWEQETARFGLMCRKSWQSRTKRAHTLLTGQKIVDKAEGISLNNYTLNIQAK